MRAVGRCFPRGDRAPDVEPVAHARLARALATAPGLAGWVVGRDARINGGFYTSHAMELVPT